MRHEIIASPSTLAHYSRVVQETRDNDSMRAWARGASGGELRAVRSQAEREGDTALLAVIRTELGRRGL